jgi:ATP-binding cassette subfamily C (CFTR/MRP) protein 4
MIQASFLARSPVFSHLNASLQGLATIRSFNADETLVNEFDQHQDLHSSAWFIFIATSRAFGFYLDVFCVIYIALVTMSFFFLTGDHQPDGGSVGLAITQSIGLTGMFQWGMRQSAELENQMTSVERILEYRYFLFFNIYIFKNIY